MNPQFQSACESAGNLRNVNTIAGKSVVKYSPQQQRERSLRNVEHFVNNMV